MTLHLKRCIPDSQRYPSNLYLINNVEDIIIFLNSLLGPFSSVLLHHKSESNFKSKF